MTPRVSKNPDKIKYVSLVRGRWVYRPYIKKADREHMEVDRNGFLKPFKLGIEADPWHRIVKAHAIAFEQLQTQSDRSRLTLRWIYEQYLKSPDYDKLAKTSRQSQKSLAKVLDSVVTISGRSGTLGDLYMHEITVQYMTRFRDKRLGELRAAGREGSMHMNSEMMFLNTLATWATQYYESVTSNPFGVKPLEKRVRNRYVTDDEYDRQMMEAGTVADWLPLLMELTYLTASRGCEAVNLKLSDIGEDNNGKPAILVRRRKGSDDTYIQISPRLQAAIDMAKTIHKTRKVSGMYLVTGLRGSTKVTTSGLQAAMKRLRKRMKDMKSIHRYGNEVDDEEKPLYWTIHDLKRKGVTDSEDSHIAGHRNDSVRGNYDILARSYKAAR